jgi:hypothetical protein
VQTRGPPDDTKGVYSFDASVHQDYSACCRHPLLLGDYLLQKDQQQAQQRSGSSRGNGARRSRRQFSNRKDDGDRATSDSDADSEDESEARLGPPVSLDTWRANDGFPSAPGVQQGARTTLTSAVIVAALLRHDGAQQLSAGGHLVHIAGCR